MDESTNELVNRGRARAGMDPLDGRAIIPAQGTPIVACPTNINLDTMRGKALALKGSGPGEMDVSAEKPLHITVTHWLVAPDCQVDEKTGEVREFVRTVLFDRAGRHFRTTAADAPLRLLMMLQLYSVSEWEQGIPIVVSVRKSKRGTMYHDIQIDMDALTTESE